MPTETQVPETHPLMIAWNAHKSSEAYENSKRWAKQEEHLEGSLWALFQAGFQAGEKSSAVVCGESV